MDAGCLASWIFSEVQDNISEVVKNVTEVVNCVHDIVFRVITIFVGNDLIEVSINVLTCSPAIEGDWMQLLCNLSDKEELIEHVININESILFIPDNGSHVNNILSVGDVIILNNLFACHYGRVFCKLSSVQESHCKV